MPSIIRSRITVWLTLGAMLFSAVSPAVAAALFTKEPAVLAQLLGVPPARVPDAHSAHEQASHHGASHSSPQHQAPHKTHGIYCSFCLNASSTLTISSVPLQVAGLVLEEEAAVIEPPLTVTVVFHPLYRSRAPPRFS
jgi:hypothetical protein